MKAVLLALIVGNTGAFAPSIINSKRGITLYSEKDLGFKPWRPKDSFTVRTPPNHHHQAPGMNSDGLVCVHVCKNTFFRGTRIPRIFSKRMT